MFSRSSRWRLLNWRVLHRGATRSLAIGEVRRYSLVCGTYRSERRCISRESGPVPDKCHGKAHRRHLCCARKIPEDDPSVESSSYLVWINRGGNKTLAGSHPKIDGEPYRILSRSRSGRRFLDLSHAARHRHHRHTVPRHHRISVARSLVR